MHYAYEMIIEYQNKEGDTIKKIEYIMAESMADVITVRHADLVDKNVEVTQIKRTVPISQVVAKQPEEKPAPVSKKKVAKKRVKR